MKKLNTKVIFIVETGKDGFGAWSKDIQGIYTMGDTLHELKKNAKEATNLYFEESGQYVNLDNIQFEIDIASFLKYNKILNDKYLAARIGMNAGLLSRYKNGNKALSVKQSDRLIKGVADISKELSSFVLKPLKHTTRRTVLASKKQKAD